MTTTVTEQQQQREPASSYAKSLFSWPPTRKNVQYISGSIFSSFLAVHVTTTLSANYGPLAYNEALSFFRIFYQNPFIEPILLGSLLVHVAAGMDDLVTHFGSLTKGLISTNSNSNNGNTIVKKDLTPVPLKLHRISAIVLSVFIVGHVLATRIVPFFYSHKFTFSHLSFTLDLLPYIFYPYYMAFGVAGIYHMCYGWLQIFRKTGISRHWSFKLGMSVLSVLMISSIYTFGTHSLRDSPPGYFRELASIWPVSSVAEFLGKKY